MSKQEIRIKLVESANGDIEVAVTGLAPVSVTRQSKSACRSAGAPGLMRIRTTVDEATADHLLLAQELFIGAMSERWDEWFKTADKDVLDDAAEPVVAIKRGGQRTVTLLADGHWPEDEDEVSVRLTRAVFDGTGLAVIWTVRSTKPPAPEPEPEAVPEPEPEPEPVSAPDAVSEKDEKRLLKAKKAKKRAKAIAAAVAAALNLDSDSDVEEA